jgi:UDPglucose 6-dehydrogenase/GDP-mannose 6-dehydrogenase
VNPEFLREGQAVQDFLHPDRIVIGGIDEASIRSVADVYAGFSAPILTTNPSTAEVIKYTSNALLATLISFSNEIAAICEAMADVDVERVMEDLYLDQRLSPIVGDTRIRPGILQYLKAGCGFGGSCLPKDVRALGYYARSLGVEPNMLEAAMRVNETRPRALVRVVERELGTLKGAQIAVLGLAFKPGTDDLRESPAIPVIAQLTSGGARVRAYDPVAGDGAQKFWSEDRGVRVSPSAVEACTGSDAAVLVTAWPEFAALDWGALRKVMANNVFVDGRRLLHPQSMEQAGFRYRGIGRGG